MTNIEKAAKEIVESYKGAKFPIFDNVHKIYGTNANWKKELNQLFSNRTLC